MTNTEDHKIPKKNRRGSCPECNRLKPDLVRLFQYVDKYDSWACSEHNLWTERFKCSDTTCDFCVSKPPRPF